MTRCKRYRAYHDMKQRCYNENNPRYKWYGARGIQVCDRWLNSYEIFFTDLGPPPSDKHSLDRIDVNGNYEPGNVRWVTQKDQLENRRNTLRWTYRGETKTLKEWAQVTGISYDLLYGRHKAGLSAEDALTKVKFKHRSFST